MRLLHTGDWHLGDRLNHIDRTVDLRRAVERVAAYCREKDVEVLVVAGDLFSERCRADGLRESIAHLHDTFQRFLTGGGTIVAITGNHDNETFCRTLCHAMALAAPEPEAGALVPSGRFYLAASPMFFRLRDRAGLEVQFVLLPYPRERIYLAESAQRYDSIEAKHRAMHNACTAKIRDIQQSERFDRSLPSVLAAHISVTGTVLPNLFRLTEPEDVVFSEEDLDASWTYVALGHIHKPQCLSGRPHVRYSGSIERLDLGEQGDNKSVVLVDIGRQGLAAPPKLLPLDARPFLEVTIADPQAELPLLRSRYPEASRALVRCLVDYCRGADDINAIRRELRTIFPHCYQMECRDPSDLRGSSGTAAEPKTHPSVRATVLDYLKSQLADHKDYEAVLQLAEQLLAKEAG
jgi:exonuclease SbcD